MNNLPKWKWNIIKWLAGNEPIILGFTMYPLNAKDNRTVVYCPADKITSEEAAEKAVLVPVKSIK